MEELKLTRDEARKHFDDLGISYESIKEIDVRKLSNILESELIDYFEHGGDHAKQMDMKVSKLRKKDMKFEDGKLVSARIQIDGSYFKRREGITFNENGFIGFGAEFSDINVQSILEAFCKWCYTL